MRYFFWFWWTVVRRACSIIAHRKKETRRACRLLDKIEKQFGGEFNAVTRRKIAVSYGIYLPMLCDAFTGLRGRKTTIEEKERFIYYFICSSLFDDFTDEHLINREQLYAISFHYEQYDATTFEEKVFRYAHQFLRDLVTDKKEYDEVSRLLYEAQIRSQQQYKSTLTREEIKVITFEKGGYSVLLCSYYLEDKAGKVEQNCWYLAGAIIQLTNDLYDIYKDLQDDITTLPDSMTNAYDFETFFTGEILEVKKEIRRLPFSKKSRQHFSLSMAGVYAFGLIAIHHLKKIQGNATALPDLKKLKRKQLIIDMEKINNLFIWFKFTYRYAKLKI